MDSRVMSLAEHGSGGTGPGSSRPSRTGPESHGQVVPLRTHRTAPPLGWVDVPPEPLVSCHSIIYIAVLYGPCYRYGSHWGTGSLLDPASPARLRCRMEGADGES